MPKRWAVSHYIGTLDGGIKRVVGYYFDAIDELILLL